MAGPTRRRIPLALVDSFRLYEVVKYISMTSHMWSGFNQMAHLPTWQRLPADVQEIIERNVAQAVRLQRQDQAEANGSLRPELIERGLAFNDVDPAAVPQAALGFLREVEGDTGRKVLVAAGRGLRKRARVTD